LLGRRCRLRDNSMNYVAVNRILQGGNADIIKWKMVQIDEYLRGEGRPVRMLANVHDAIDYEFPESARHVYTNCLKIMEDFSYGPFALNIPMKVDAGEGANWAVATYGEPALAEGIAA
jgi:DNA polymerase I